MNIEQSEFGWPTADPSDSHDYLLPAVLREVRKRHKERKIRILDLGCGNGYVASRLAELGHEVMAIDAARDGINIARSAYPHMKFFQHSIYEEEWAEIEEGSFDCVVSLEVVEHLFYPKLLFEKSYRLIKTGGHLILSTPYHGYWKNLALSLVNGWDKHFHVSYDGGHIKFFSPKTLKEMAATSGFRNIEIFGSGRLPGLWKSMIMTAHK